jgi:hypothetical protein
MGQRIDFEEKIAFCEEFPEGGPSMSINARNVAGAIVDGSIDEPRKLGDGRRVFPWG